MSDSAQSPGSSDGSSPPTPVGEGSPPADTQPPPSNSPPATPEEPSPPSEQQNTSPPTLSIGAPPPPDSSSSSSSPPPPSSSPLLPSSSSPPPPSPKLGLNSPLASAPPGSNSSSPSGLGTSPPPPPVISNFPVPTPPSSSNTTYSSPPSQSDTSPPKTSSSPSSPSPPSSVVHHPPPPVAPKHLPSPSETPQNSSPPPPTAALQPPAASNGSPSPVAGILGSPQSAVSPPLPDTPPISIPSPGSVSQTLLPNPTPPSEVTPSTPAILTPPTSQTSNNVPILSPPSTQSDHGSFTSSQTSHSLQSSGISNSGSITGITLAGVVIIALVAIFFMISRRRKKQIKPLTAQYLPAPNNFSAESGGSYHKQQYTTGSSGQSDTYYGSKPPGSPSAVGNSYGSYGGNVLSSGSADSGLFSGAKSWFSYEELMEITNGFSRQNVLGEGGFGCVYKGWLPDGRLVAVKQLKVGSGQGEREFRAEVEIISRVHHRHLVSLVGYCVAEHHRLLVYEFVPNNTLEHHLHEKGMPAMDWSKRVKTAIGAARGLAYLHEDCHPKIIHRDIKSANILLDDAFEAKVADFGLAKLANDTSTHVSTRVMGTFGYMAPEYASSGKLTDRSDVFSFGVVLLELVTGRKPVDPTRPLGDESLVEWARPLLVHALDTQDFGELPDPRLENRYVESEMFRMIEAAAACVRHSAPKRPRMVQLVRALDSMGDVPDLSNGMKFGQSTVYESRQYSADVVQFRRLAFGSGYSSEYNMYSEEYGSREAPRKPPSSQRHDSSSEFDSGDSETYAMNPQSDEWHPSKTNANYGRRRTNQR